MIQIFTLDVDARAPEMFGQVLGEGERGGAAGIAAHELDVLGPEVRVAARRLERERQLFERGVQNFGDVRTAEAVEIASICANRFSHGGAPWIGFEKRRARRFGNAVRKKWRARRAEKKVFA